MGRKETRHRRQLQVFHAVSNLTKEKFLQEYPTVDPNRVRVIHPGIDAQRFSGLDRIACRREIRERFGMGPQDSVILFASMNIDIRGLDRLVEGLARVRRRPERFHGQTTRRGEREREQVPLPGPEAWNRGKHSSSPGSPTG